MSLRSRKDVLMFLLGLTPEDNLQQQYSDAKEQKQELKLQQATLDHNLFRRIWESHNLFLSKFSCVENGSKNHHN